MSGTDSTQSFKKEYQVVGRPSVTDHDINDEYMRDPPHNEPTGLSQPRQARGIKEGAREETDPKVEGVLGDEPTGKVLKQDALEDLTQESSMHPNNTS